MPAFDDQALRADPAKIVAGGVAGGLERTTGPGPDSPACHAALATFRPALMFRYIFTAFVAVLGAMTTVALVYSLWRILEGWNAAATLTAISAVITGGAAVTLGKKMMESIAVLRQALEDVSTYCGADVTDRLK
jgi:hypothetical protein